MIAEEVQAAVEGELSNRIVFPSLLLDIRGTFDKHAAKFDHEKGAAFVGEKASITVSLIRVKAVFDQLEGATVEIYDPDFIGDEEAVETYRCMVPEKYENTTVEINLEAV